MSWSMEATGGHGGYLFAYLLLFQTQRQLSDAVWNVNHWKETHSNVLDVNILHSITQEKGQKYAFLVR